MFLRPLSWRHFQTRYKKSFHSQLHVPRGWDALQNLPLLCLRSSRTQCSMEKWFAWYVVGMHYTYTLKAPPWLPMTSPPHPHPHRRMGLWEWVHNFCAQPYIHIDVPEKVTTFVALGVSLTAELTCRSPIATRQTVSDYYCRMRTMMAT